jgi:hypothetical protein
LIFTPCYSTNASKEIFPFTVSSALADFCR